MLGQNDSCVFTVTSRDQLILNSILMFRIHTYYVYVHMYFDIHTKYIVAISLMSASHVHVCQRVGPCVVEKV